MREPAPLSAAERAAMCASLIHYSGGAAEQTGPPGLNDTVGKMAAVCQLHSRVSSSLSTFSHYNLP